MIKFKEDVPDMNKRIISMAVVIVMVLSMGSFSVVASAPDAALSSQVYVLSSDRVDDIPPDTMVNTLLYNIRRDNPNFTFDVLNAAGARVSYDKVITSKMRLAATDADGNTMYYSLGVSGVYKADDDFEKYPIGHFGTNPIWSTTNQNSSAQIVNLGGNRVYSVTVKNTQNDESYIETYQKGISGESRFKIKLLNKYTNNGNVQVYLRDNVNNATNGVFYLFNLSPGKLTCLSNSNKTEVSCDDSAWLDMTVVINENDKSIKVLNGDTQIAGLKDYTKYQSSFDWSNFKIRVLSKIRSSATGDAQLYIDDFSYEADCKSQSGLSFDNVYSYQNGNYTDGITAGSNTLAVRTHNNTGKADNIMVVAAQKKGGELVGVSMSEHISAPGRSYLTVDIEADSAADKSYELYVWKKDGLVPIGYKQRLPLSKATAAMSVNHPRLIADNSVFDSISNSSNPVKKLAQATVIDYAGKIVKGFTTKGSYLNDEFYIGEYDANFLDMSKRVKKFSVVLSMAYQLTGNTDYTDTLVRVLYAAGGLDDWNPSHYLDVAEMTSAFAIGYDWCYDALTPEQKSDISSFVFDKALSDAILYYDGTKGLTSWTYSNINWNAVVNSSLMMGAIAFAESDPVLCGRIIEYSQKSLQNVLAELAPDGGWHEGIAYLKYTLEYLTQLSSTLDTVYGEDTLIIPASGFEKTADFLMAAYGPAGYHNYADMDRSSTSPSELFYIADVFDRSDVHSFALAHSSQSSPEVAVSALLWCSDSFAAVDLPLTNYYSRNIEHISFATEANGKRAWLSAIGGINGLNHSHMDLGSFVYDYDGIRWALDLGSESYYDDYFEINKGLSSGRWSYYKARAEGHNTLVLNPSPDAGQLDTANAFVTRHSLGGDTPYAIYDLTGAYSDNADGVSRGFMLLPGGGAVIRDEITTDEDTLIYWFMHTDAEISLSADGKKATLTKNGKSVDVVVYEDSLSFDVKAAGPMSQIGEYSGNDYPSPDKQSSNNGISKLMIKSSGTGSVTVCIAPEGGTMKQICSSLDKWD